ncbi:MAG: MotA/TolQ/ExbB proton channel family protein [Deltaproteobacteria bacterium]|nr:MotA/TolQ/ExbB proton channel family protein [Deltaproteobacteria bacterium]MBW1961719.1 MotA/TolQ/ExbB proton channel family protein [Deltaproteobacteria bacterium]MBW1995975.1 MotA/TolQ/ExbB proton channel family protein [Deltaproteobacteria bacterium]MBW2153783.1 MotA/TolQ/ExbB proton channel family protein [Deltaproteobacteria bacterium]
MYELFRHGGPVMYPLLVCSVISLTVIIERFLFWIRVGLNRNRSLVNKVLELSRVGDWERIRSLTKGSEDYIVRIIVAGILHREFSMTKAMETAAADEIQNMQKYMGVLDTMITVAPLLGIFGTVLGIILSFEAIGSAGIDRPQAVTAGISQALITTAAGLGIAILSVFPYNYFNSRIAKAALTIEKYATSLEIVYQKHLQVPRKREDKKDESKCIAKS